MATYVTENTFLNITTCTLPYICAYKMHPRIRRTPKKTAKKRKNHVIHVLDALKTILLKSLAPPPLLRSALIGCLA